MAANDWLDALPGAVPTPAATNIDEIRQMVADLGASSRPDGADRGAPETAWKLPQLTPDTPSKSKLPSSAGAAKKWRATYELTAAIKKGATLRSLAALSGVAKRWRRRRRCRSWRLRCRPEGRPPRGQDQ
ncbi:unnamed protein product [Effrenium voratum]|nr:unnamed protein product [Effrenium voratum]